MERARKERDDVLAGAQVYADAYLEAELRADQIEHENTVLVDQMFEVACRADIERGMAGAHQKNAMRFADTCSELRADIAARDAALDACQSLRAALAPLADRLDLIRGAALMSELQHEALAAVTNELRRLANTGSTEPKGTP